MLHLGPDHREVGHLAVWTVTSAKPGNGVEALRDGRDDTYWQSDGAQPHLVNIQFQRKVRLSAIALLLNFKLDESYTPSKIAIRAGTTHADLKEVHVETLTSPQGWHNIPLQPPNQPDGTPLKAYLVQVAVLVNHQNGRDTHLRQVRIFGPRPSPNLCTDTLEQLSPEFELYSCVR